MRSGRPQSLLRLALSLAAANVTPGDALEQARAMRDGAHRAKRAGYIGPFARSHQVAGAVAPAKRARPGKRGKTRGGWRAKVRGKR